MRSHSTSAPTNGSRKAAQKHTPPSPHGGVCGLIPRPRMTDAGGNSWFPAPIAHDRREREFVSGRPVGRTHWQAALFRPCGMVRPVTQKGAKMQYECMTTCTMPSFYRGLLDDSFLPSPPPLTPQY
ncbi:hypothetical protein [Desulfosporosinus burensis]